MTVKLIRMWSGEDVITDVVEETNEYYKIENPIVASHLQKRIGLLLHLGLLLFKRIR